MIRILSYKEHPRGKKIFDRYLYLAAYVLPFPVEDVIWDDVLEVDGENYTAADFLEKKKRQRNRDKNYLDLLEENGVGERGKDFSKEEKLAHDAQLAEKLINKASEDLHAFLYEKEGNGKIRKDNLRKLLTVKMDDFDDELKKIGKIKRSESDILLKEVFRYEPFSKNEHAVEMLKDMDVNVCPYCNRMYTVTLVKKNDEVCEDEKSGKKHKSRPQFDHYINKSDYPYLAVSLMNLIPCCGLCNQSKGKSNKRVLYPYSDEMGTDVMFQTECEGGVTYLTGNRNAADEFSVTLKILNPDLDAGVKERVKSSNKEFNLTELYDMHKDYILYLFRKNYIFSEDYLKTLYEEFGGLFESLEDVRNMMYLMDIDKEQWGRRPLAKLTHDIDREIRELNKK